MTPFRYFVSTTNNEVTIFAVEKFAIDYTDKSFPGFENTTLPRYPQKCPNKIELFANLITKKFFFTHKHCKISYTGYQGVRGVPSPARRPYMTTMCRLLGSHAHCNISLIAEEAMDQC